MYLKNISKYAPALAALFGMALSSCSEDTMPTAAGEGEIVFKAQLKQTAEALTGDRKIALTARGNSYTYTMATDGTMTAEGAALEWTGEEFGIKAWTPYTTGAVTLTDQTTSAKHDACDLLAAQTTASSRYVFLMFDHQMSRLTWTLRHVDSSYTDEQVKNAKISFLGYASAGFNGGEVSVSGSPDSEIAAYETESDGMRHGDAIMAPADMWGKPLIKIVIGGDEYFYTPDRANAADVASGAGSLTAGKWQKYNLSITRKTLVVQTETSAVEWGSSHVFGDGDITDAKLTAKVAADVTDKPGYSVSGLDHGFVLDRQAGFTISYDESALGGLNWTGDCKVTRTESALSGNTTVQTYKFTDIKSDITVSYLSGVEVGDYVYDNGTWGKQEKRDGCKTVGRVFHVGLDSRDDSSYSLCKVRGYVVPLSVADTGELKWFVNQSNQTFVQALANIPVSDNKETRESYFGGYKLTGLLNTALSPYSAEWAEQVPFWYAFKNLDMPAPALSSGWYIPTFAQLKDVCASGMYDKFVGAFLSSQVYVGTEGGDGFMDGAKNTLWAIRCDAAQNATCGWAIDAAKLLPILTF